MKKIILIFILLFTKTISAEDDSLYVEMNHDTLIVCNVNVWENCAFSPIMNVEIIDSLIKITEKDTSLVHTTCSSYHNYYIPITGLDERSYRIEIYRAYTAPYYPDTAQFITSINAEFIITDIQNNDVQIVSDCKLYNAYPNPFNPVTNISYFIPKDEKIKIIVFDALGKQIQHLFEGYQYKGRHNLQFNANRYASGTYYIKLITDKISATNKIILIK